MIPQVTLSLTETRQYERLVNFAADVSDYARLTRDDDLERLVRDLYAELLGDHEQ